MANLQKLLNDEIHRLAKKEAKAALEPLKTQVAKLRVQIADQKEQIRNLQKNPSEQKPEPAVETTVDESKKPNGFAERIKRIRTKLGFSQNTFAKLLGVCYYTVSRWESGTCLPNNEAKAKIIELSKIGKRELQKRLDSISNS